MSHDQAFYLDVSFRDKEIVKQLGARWDSSRKSWFVPVGVPVERFARWHPKEHSSVLPSGGVPIVPFLGESTVKSDGRSTSGQGMSLSSVLFEVSEWVRKGWSKLQWVIAEVADIKASAQGHYYLELVEHDVQGRQIAKVNAKIWSNQSKIIRNFEKNTGVRIEKGIKLLFLANAEFSIQYGFSLTIEEFDSNWTLGEMELQKRKIREKLQAEGIWEKNKKLGNPKDFVKVALIAPIGAAGLGDFLADSNALEKEGLCTFDLFPATFEGIASQGSLVAAFQKITPGMGYDVVVILRGGGASSSLNWLNDEHVARCICECPYPVFTGLGHQRDSTILDEVSALDFDTPSKVIGFIMNQITQNAQAGYKNFEFIFAQSQLLLERSEHESEQKMTTIYEIAGRTLESVEQKIENALDWTFQAALQQIQQIKTENEQLLREILGLGPQKVLERGYAIVKKQGQVVAKANEVGLGDSLEIQFSEGSVNVLVQHTAKT